MAAGPTRRRRCDIPCAHGRARALVAVGLILTTILPGASASAAAGDLVLRAGTDQDLQVLNPFESVLVADFEVFTLNYDLLVNFGPDIEPAPGFAESWTQSTDGKTWTFKIRPGMKWSDGQPATSEDARWTYQTILDGVASERGYLGEGYLEGYLTDAGVKTVTAPDRDDPRRRRPSSRTPSSSRPTSRSCPKHIWSKYSLAQIGDPKAKGFFKNEPPIVGTGPYQVVEWKPGDFIRFARNPNYWGKQGAADEVILQHFASGDTMVQALKTGEVDYVRGVLADQFNALKTEPNIVRPSRASPNGYTELSFNTGGNKKGYGGSTSALSRRRVPRRPRLRDRQPEARRHDPRRLRHAGLDDHPAVPYALARRAGQAPQVRHRGGQAPSSTPPATSSTRAANASTRTARSSTSA